MAQAAALAGEGRSAAPPAGLGKHRVLELYFYMRLTRSLEERLVNLYRQGKVVGGLYRSLGQEADAVGSAYALDASQGDVLSPLIRNLGSLLVMGAQPVEILRQYMAKAASPTRGRELNLHFGDLERGFIGQISHLGDMVPVMAGVTLSFKVRRRRSVGMVYIGDGGSSTGAFHEGLNFAAVQRLPLVVVAENNGYAFSTPVHRQMAVERMVDKAAGYGVPGVRADGNDVLAVYQLAKEAVERARAGGGVTLIELVTYRRKGHAEHDDQHYVPKAEIAAWEEKDPLDAYARRIVGEGWAAAEELEAVDRRIAEDLTAAVKEVEGEPPPEPGSALVGVYADPPAAPTPWFRRG